MQIRFSIGHHPPGDRFRLTDILAPIMAACDDLGIDTAVRDDEALELDTMTLFTEFFVPEMADFIIKAKQQLKDDFRFGVLLTEDLRDQLIWTDARAPHRLEGLKKVAAVADCLVSLLPDLDALSELAPREKIAYLPLGRYPDILPSDRDGARKDIDVVFLGTDRGHRKPILDALRDAGLTVALTNGIATDLVRRSMVSHAKVALDIRRGPEVRFLSPSRLSYLISAGIPIVSEKFDETPLGAEWYPYVDAVPYDDLVEKCQAVIRDPDSEAHAKGVCDRMLATKTAANLLGSMLHLPVFSAFNAK